MKNLELIISIAATAVPLAGAVIGCVVKLIKSLRYGKEEHKRRAWAEFAQEAIGYVEALRGKANGELTGETKREIALNKVEAACVKNGIRFERDKVAELMESIVTLTKAVNARDKDKPETGWSFPPVPPNQG